MEVTGLAEILTVRGKTVSVAEADTCGLVGYMLGTVPGASKYFPGGVIAYSGGLKERILGIPDELSKTYGTVSEEMAIAMAKGVRELTGTAMHCRLPESPAPVRAAATHPSGPSSSACQSKTPQTRQSRSTWTETGMPSSAPWPRRRWTCWGGI